MGTPLKDWDIQINYGIKTGFNEAFIIDGKTKDELIAKSSKNAEIIRPILRGRDIKRYGYDFADKWLICTHNGTESEPAINIEEYPDVKEYLDQYYTQLAKRQDKGTTPYNLRSCNYWDDFSRQKIVWKAVGRNLAFSTAESNVFLVNPSSFLVSVHIIYLLGVLNSSYMKYYIYSNSDTTGAGDIMLNIIFLLNCLIPNVNKREYLEIENIVYDIIELKNNNKNHQDLDDKLDYLLYKKFKFSDEEIFFIENQYS